MQNIIEKEVDGHIIKEVIINDITIISCNLGYDYGNRPCVFASIVDGDSVYGFIDNVKKVDFGKNIEESVYSNYDRGGEIHVRFKKEDCKFVDIDNSSIIIDCAFNDEDAISKMPALYLEDIKENLLL